MGAHRKSSDPSAEDWIEDAQMVMASMNLREEEQVAFLLKHLCGKARTEILGRGADVKKDPSRIFAVLCLGTAATCHSFSRSFTASIRSMVRTWCHCHLNWCDCLIAYLCLTPFPNIQERTNSRTAWQRQ